MDIEPRIEAICKFAPEQEEASLQESLSSYGWILLDSWVAWRTERFLLRDINIDDSVDEKWLRTPSSYTARQLITIWQFQESTLLYIEQKTGKTFQHLINGTIQKNRNSFAHYSENTSAQGQDSRVIKQIYLTLSTTFLFYEISSFLKEVATRLKKRKFEDFFVRLEDREYPLEDVWGLISRIDKSEDFYFLCKRDSNSYYLYFSIDGVEAGIEKDGNKVIKGPVANEAQKQYRFFDSKGYYQNIECFINTVLSCWSAAI